MTSVEGATFKAPQHMAFSMELIAVWEVLFAIYTVLVCMCEGMTETETGTERESGTIYSRLSSND